MDSKVASSACPIASSNYNCTGDSQIECPVATEPINYLNMMPNIENKALSKQQQQEPELPRERIISSIPKGNTDSNWMYPSQQMFYNALQKKGYSRVHQDDVKILVPIHNIVNEKCWIEILKWEQLLGR